ncbi:MAG: hypothetical protein UR84_C0021G0004 [candidate division WS6 bacterium GW2011_GWD1_35_594]|nr:MAG: hypothetical protein UR84_C0021G0004 [candidate division WS6 bacterium GW2011_GWD1_35_594]
MRRDSYQSKEISMAEKEESGSDNMRVWNSVDHPPGQFLRPIQAGRLKGKTDINPQWRYMAMTQAFGPCGFGWKYRVTEKWLEQAVDGQVCAFATIELMYKLDGEWSDPIPGLGGSMFTAKETNGLYSSDEAYKMAITDALSVAMKVLGVAADVYAGLWDGSKYREVEGDGDKKPPKKTDEPKVFISAGQLETMKKELEGRGADMEKFKALAGVAELGEIEAKNYDGLMKQILKKKKKAEAEKKPENKPEDKVPEKVPETATTFECPQVPGLMLSGTMCSAAACSGECKAYKEFTEGRKK